MLNFSLRLYRLLLRAYPADFRQEYGAVMAQLFRDGLRDAGQQGAVAAGVFWLHALFDLIGNAIGERMSTFRLSLPGERFLHILGILVAAATWPLLLWTLIFCLLIAGDPADGAATGTFQDVIAHLIARPPVLVLLPLLILGYSSLIMARSALNGCDGRWLAWRFALVNLLACPVLLGAMLGIVRVVTLIFPPDRIAYIGIAHYPAAAYVVLISSYGLLTAGLLKLHRLAANSHQSHVVEA